jgi:hypothetical protein
MKKTLLLLSVTVFSLHNIRAQEWKELGVGSNALNGNGGIQALASDKMGNIYAGGQLRTSSAESMFDTFYVAKWDGNTWTELGTGNAALNANNQINTITTDSSGNVYAAGDFEDELGKSYVAKWNGSTWTELGSGINALAANNHILSVVVDQFENVYAAGEFTDSNYYYHYVAKWDGSTWTALGNLNANGTIRALAIDALGNVYAAGGFKDSLGKCYVAKWDGNSWEHLGSGINSNLGNNSFISRLVIDPIGNIYVTGYITDTNNVSYVAKLNGNTWVPLENASTPLSTLGGIYGLTIGRNNHVCVAEFSVNSGRAHVAEWEGNSWHELDTGANALMLNDAILTLIADPASNLYIGGGFFDSTYHFYVAEYGDSIIPPVGITDLSSENNVIVAPNPAKSFVMIENLKGYTQLNIISISGVTVLHQKITQDTEIIPVNSLSSGMYLLQLNGNMGKSFFRLIKE